MWMKKIQILIMVLMAIISARARISDLGNGYSYDTQYNGLTSNIPQSPIIGLQNNFAAKIPQNNGLISSPQVNDLGSDQSYSQLDHGPIQASLAYYVNIPANHEVKDHFSTAGNHFTSQFNGVQSPNLFGEQGYRQGATNSVFRPSNFDNRGPVQSYFNSFSSNSNQNSYREPFQVETRNIPNNPIYNTFTNSNQGYIIIPSIEHKLTSNSIRNSINQDSRLHNQQYRQPEASRDYLPPSDAYDLKRQLSAPAAVASFSQSYNARLPFPFGVVPIKSRPLPLKTHLRQNMLIPITSYEASVPYKK